MQSSLTYQATVPAKLIFVLMSLNSLEVPKSEIFIISPCPIKMLQRGENLTTQFILIT